MRVGEKNTKTDEDRQTKEIRKSLTHAGKEKTVFTKGAVTSFMAMKVKNKMNGVCFCQKKAKDKKIVRGALGDRMGMKK